MSVVGVGAMGRRIAVRLLNAGHEVAIWNRSSARMESLVELGAKPVATPAEAASRGGVLITMVSDPAALRAVTEGRDGVAAGAAPGLTVLEMSTVGPSAIARLAGVLPNGVGMIDAPVMGSVDAAESGTLTIFAGGEFSLIERHKELLSVLGSMVHVGPAGSGAAAKLVANATIFASLGLLGEALALAQGLGLSGDAAFRVLAATPVAAQAERRRPSIESNDFPPRFPLGLAGKDAGLISEAAAVKGLRLPLIDAALVWIEQAAAEGLGGRDYTAVLAAVLAANKHSESMRFTALSTTQPTNDESRDRRGLRAFDGFIVDLDGVIWRGDQPIAGAAETIEAIRSGGRSVVFVTNEPRRSTAEVALRLSEFGIATTSSEVVTSAAATARVLRSLQDLPNRSAVVIGPPALHDEISGAGFELVSDDRARHAAVVVVGGHENFDYSELVQATTAIHNGARLFATGRDAVYPTLAGPRPATGAILAAVETAGGTTATVIAKPEPVIFEMAREALPGCQRIAVIGDNLIGDVAGAKRSGFGAILVLSGITARADLEAANVAPDYVLESIAELLPAVCDR